MQLVNGVTFALVNTTVSKAIKCTPYEVVHGRAASLPLDVKLGISTELVLGDLSPPREFAKHLNDNLYEIYSQVNINLGLNRVNMKRQYDKNVRVNSYTIGQKVWLKSKYYMTGESKKLTPRKFGPWTMTKILENGVNFEIKRDSNSDKIIVHHDRIIPMKLHPDVSNTKESSTEPDSDDNDDTKINGREPGSGDGVNSDPEIENTPDQGDENANVDRRYPLRNRTQRQIPGAIPWEAIQGN